MISVGKGAFIKRVTTLSLIAISTCLLVSQSGISIAADYPPRPAPSLEPAPLPSAGALPLPSATPEPLPSPTAAPLPSPTAAPLPSPTAAPLPSTPPMPTPVALPTVTAPVQVVVATPNQSPAAPPIPIAANSATQVTVDGKFVPVNVAPQQTPPPGTVGVAVTGDGFTFSLGTTSTDNGNTTVGSVTMINGQPALNTPQRTNLTTSGTGFRTNDQVALFVFSKAVFLGNIKTNAAGEFNASVKLPKLPLGAHHLQATGVTKDGKSRTINLLLYITAPVVVANPVNSPLPLVVIVAALLLLLVLFWVFLTKKRKSEEDEPDLIAVSLDKPEYVDDLVDINSRINALIKKQKATKKGSTAPVKALPRKKVVSKKRAKI